MNEIVLEIPEELKVMVPALRDAVDSAMAQVERARLGDAIAYATFEREISEKLCEVERRAHEAALTALDPDLPKLLINKVVHTRVLEDVSTTFMTQPGPVKVTRSLYRPVGERNAPVVDLVALRAGAIEGVWLPATAREMAFDVQQLTSREAETNGNRKGRLPYSHSSFEHVAHAVGEKYVQQHEPIEQVLIEDFEVPDETRTVTASLDRVCRTTAAAFVSRPMRPFAVAIGEDGDTNHCRGDQRASGDAADHDGCLGARAHPLLLDLDVIDAAQRHLRDAEVGHTSNVSSAISGAWSLNAMTSSWE